MPVVSQILQTVLTLNTAGFITGMKVAAGELDRFSTKSSTFGSRSLAAAGIATAGFALLGKAALEAGHDTASFARAVASFKGGFPLADMQAFTGSLQNLVGIEDDVIAQSLGLLGTFGLTANEAKKLELPILNATEALKAQGATAESVAVSVGKAIESANAGALRRSGIIIDQDAFAGADRAQRVTMVMEALQRQAGDAAIVFRKTLPGAIQAFNTEVQSAFGNVGKALDGPAKGMLEWTINLIKAFNDAGPVVHGTAAAIGVTLTGAAIVAFGWLKALEFQNIKLMNSMLKTAGAAEVQGTAMAGMGAKAGTSWAAGFIGKAIPLIAAGIAAAEIGSGVRGVVDKQEGAPKGVSAEQMIFARRMIEIGHPERITNAGARKAVGLDGGAVAAPGAATAGKTADQEIIALLQAQLDEQKKLNGTMSAGALPTSDVPLMRQLAARQVRVFGA